MKQLDEETELEYLILNILRLHGREINPDFGKKSKQIYDYSELSLYTQEKIAEASRRMYKKGWIYIFDEGTPYWHELKDKVVSLFANTLKRTQKKIKCSNPVPENQHT